MGMGGNGAVDGGIGEAMKQGLARLIDLAGSLRRLLDDEEDLAVPGIVVVGDQSHGKSSLIEAISGIELPRGMGMKTKMPLVIKLRSGEDEGAVIRCDGEEREVQLSDVASAIEEITMKVVGDEDTVSATEIELTVTRKNNANLDLIDLPGIFRVTETPEVVEQIKKLYGKFMKGEATVICNVVSASVDPKTAESLQLSKAHDKRLERTLLCVTKVDEVSEGNAKAKVEDWRRIADEYFDGNTNALFFVRNRSQAETDNKRTLEDAIAEEDGFFRSSSSSNLASELHEQGFEGLGRKRLIEHLVKVQSERIKKWLPKLRGDIESRLAQHRCELAELRTHPTTAPACEKVLRNVLSDLNVRLGETRAGRLQLATSHDEVMRFVVNEKAKKFQPKEATSKCGRWTITTNHDDDEENPFSYTVKKNQDDSPAPSVSAVYLNNDVEILHWTTCSGAWCYDDEEDLVEDALLMITLRDSRRSEEMACSYFASELKEFSDAVRQSLPMGFFFSEDMLADLGRRHDCVRGHDGLPGQNLPDIAFQKARELQQACLYDLALKFAENAAARCTERWVHSAVNEACRMLPKLEAFLIDIFDEKITSLKQELRDKLEENFKYFDTMSVEDHYVMSVLDDIRDRARCKYKALGSLTRDKLRLMSIEERKVVTDAEHLYAYWKAMRKEFAGQVFRVVKFHAFSSTTQEAFCIKASAAVEGRVVELVGASDVVRRNAEKLDARIVKLEKSLREFDACHEARLL